MKIQQIAEEVVELIRDGKNKEAKDTFYADDIVSVEGNGYRLEGIEAIHQKSIDWMEQLSEVHSVSVSEPLVSADHFAISIKMDISYKNGHRAIMDEIAVYGVDDGKIVFEQFFFKS
jgi:ketosteroid isomerase-like protein